MPISEELTARGLLTEEQVARILCVAPTTPGYWRGAGRGPRFVKIGKRVFYHQSDVDAWIDQQTRTPSPAAA
jgi:predicted DNA-binding transcriptional regulator AlpA